jgi:hypothetical protein
MDTFGSFDKEEEDERNKLQIEQARERDDFLSTEEAKVAN